MAENFAAAPLDPESAASVAPVSEDIDIAGLVPVDPETVDPDEVVLDAVVEEVEVEEEDKPLGIRLKLKPRGVRRHEPVPPAPVEEDEEESADVDTDVEDADVDNHVEDED